MATLAVIDMKKLLQQFEEHLSLIHGIEDELLPPITSEDLDAAEKELEIKFPEEFRQLYMWHNGNQGDSFLFGQYRISPITEVLELYESTRKFVDKDWYQVTNNSEVFKDCIANTKWIQFADNGGNTIVYLDLDPAKQGVVGQILESCDGDIECHFDGIQNFISDINNNISQGNLEWDDEAGSFSETDEESVAERKRSTEKMALIDGSTTLGELKNLDAGVETVLIGAIKPNHDNQKHQLFIKGGLVWINGDVGKIQTPLTGVPPLVRIKVRVEKKRFFGFGVPVCYVIECERVTQ